MKFASKIFVAGLKKFDIDSKDLPQKYLLALDSRISLNEAKDGKKNTKDKGEEPINKEQLISRTHKLFAEDVLYEKIKEKLIGRTIYYQADFNTNYESIIEKYVKHEKQKNNCKAVRKLF